MRSCRASCSRISSVNDASKKVYREDPMKLNRRNFLRTAGVSLALPWLDAFAAAGDKPKRRMVCICTPLGLHPAYFFPEKAGKDYQVSAYLEVIKDFRDDFTVISGLAHAGMNPGFAHQAS